MILKPLVNGAEFKKYFLDLEEAQLLTKTGSYYYNFSTRTFSCTRGYLAIHEIDTCYNTIEDFLKSIHPADQASINGFVLKLADFFSNSNHQSPSEISYRIVAQNTKAPKIIKDIFEPHFHSKKLIGLKGSIQDITNQHDHHPKDDIAALRFFNPIRDKAKTDIRLKNDELFNNILTNIPVGVLFLKAETVTYANPTLLDILGFNSIDEFPKNLWLDIATTDTRSSVNKHLKLVKVDGNTSGVFVGNFFTKAGDVKTLEIHRKLVVIANEHYCIDTISDVSNKLTHKLTETNLELKRVLTDLKEVSETKENFLSIMSHEIRTPLNSVIGLSNLLIRRNPREDQIEVVKTLKNSADNLMHLVNDILDFNKIRSGKLELELIPFSLTEFLQQQYAAFKLSAQDKNLNLLFKVDPLIPDQLRGDVTRLNQIFTNLLTNAIKFTHAGYVKLEVSLKDVDENKCSVVFTVEDTGIGIAPDKHEFIFLPFHQSDPTISRKYGGTGLGLSIVKSLIKLMNGNLALSSEVDKGSRFVIDLDFALHMPVAETVLPQSPQLVNAKESSAKKRIQNVLYVEDVESNRFLIENLLRDHHIHCVAVSSGKAALRFTLRKKFDVILMDIQMPVMDGYMTTKKIHSQANGKNRKTPVIAFTAEPYSTLLKNTTIQHGIQYVITKPFNPDELIEKIKLYASPAQKGDLLFTFDFYDEMFGHDPAKLKQIKKAVIKDFTRFKKMLLKYDAEQKLLKMREEIHRIRPIVKNLRCNKLIFVLEKYRLYNEYNKYVRSATRESVKIVSKILLTLSE